MYLGKAVIEKMNELGSSGIPFLFIIDFEGNEPVVYPISGLPPDIRFSLPGYSADPTDVPGGIDFTLKKAPVSFPVYESAFNRVMNHLRQGNSYLVNLTFPTPVQTSLTLSQIFEYSRAPYRLLWDHHFVVFSPEPFIRISEGMISSFPMKGTIDASLPDAEQRLLGDRKETAEHNTIVDLIRNDISRVADQVEVVRYRYIERIVTHEKEILQMSSEIRGRLPDGYQHSIGSLLDALLPAGSISGAPKKRTVEIIREAEPVPRGYYTGIFGVFDGVNLDSAVMIRFIGRESSGLVYRSGGGITHLSDPESEYLEMIDKVYLPK